ncbi:hypothetical protein [Leuconostoc citreum]|uniref:hypothetical protein n=2 Tax=Leuconostoc citreum TaxID=33964 RepID=UPI00111ECA22|nr:hypothetical protein [Leuconostoc citreum]QQE97566.1 hypothetical protein LeuC0096_05180 [Leuconostoc citreum]TOY70762.1 hypothetical protein DIS12_04725 [Leuconostoc citreum]
MKNRNKIIALGAMMATLLLIFLLIRNDINPSEGSSQNQSSSSEESVSYSSSDDESDTSSSSEEDDESESSEESESNSTTSDDSDKDPDSYKTGITYDQIARTPDDYTSKKVQYTGKVIQVIEDDDTVQIRLAVDGNSDNIILINIDNSLLNGSRVLENDLVTASGISKGTISYKSTLGRKITVPSMEAKIINDQGKAKNDYGN